MNGETIKQFLVGLGFGVDDASLAKFTKAIASATVKVVALYATIKIAAAGIFASITKISEGFEQMGYEYRIIAPMINKALVLRRELLKAYAAAGINIVKVVRESVKFNFALAKTKFALQAIYQSVGSRFFPALTKQLDVFRSKIYANMPKIQAALEKFIKFIFKAFEATVTLGTRVWSILQRIYDFFVQLDEKTNGWSTIILGVIAAWKLLNLEFLATPLGMIIAGMVALLALFDDFKTWEEGGESLFNWTKFLPIIAEAKKYIESLTEAWKSLVDVVGNFVLALYQAFKGDFRGFFDSLANAGRALLGVFTNLWDALKGIIGTFGSVANLVGDAFSDNPNIAANLKGPALGNQGSPLGAQGGNNSLTNQNVSQQTNINVNGAADASSVGKFVLGEQGKVNFDMVRNLKGATR